MTTATPPRPNLKLTVTKGPSSGLSTTHSAKTKVQIGRIISGNKLTIKDPGISSKHLLIQFKPNPPQPIRPNSAQPNLAQWTITDLDSSNGTILNSNPLKPLITSPLSDGDVIKFGEETVIEVGIEEEGEEELGKGRRVTRRRGGELGVIEEERELGLGFAVELGEKRKRVCRVKEIEEEGELRFGEELGKKGKRDCRSRGGKNRDSEIGEESDLGVGVGEEVEKRDKRVCRSRGGKNRNSVIGEESDIPKRVLGRGRGGKNGDIEVGESDLPKRVLGRGRVRKNGNDETEIGKEGVFEEERGVGFGVGEELGETGERACRGRGEKNGSIEIEIGKEEGVEGESDLESGGNEDNTEIVNEGEKLQNLGGNEVKDVGMASGGLRRVTRSSRRIGNDGDKIGEGMASVGLRRVTRSSRRIGNAGDKVGEGIGDTGTGRVTRGGRMTRSSRIKEMSEIKGYDVARGTENIDVVWSERQNGQAKSHKRKMGTPNKNCDLGENVVEGGLVVNSEVIDGRSKGCRRVRKKLEVEAKATESLEDGQIIEEAIKEKYSLRGEQDCGDGENNGESDRVESMQQNVCGDRLSSLKKINLDVLARLEKLTFGEWLDYIEEYLPKQIVAETEEMITEMRRKAEKFHEFMLQQKAEKGGGDI